MLFLSYTFSSNILLALLSNQDRYNFFQQFHYMLERNLSQEGKQLFYDYLKSCREKLQDEKDRYRLLYPREWILIGVFIFGIIASATVLTIYFMGIYAATWFFWFGIVGVALTILVGAYLGLCIRENYNEIKPINRAMEAYDLDKIRNFKEPKTEKISTISVNESNKIEEINTNNPSNDLKLNPIDTESSKTES